MAETPKRKLRNEELPPAGDIILSAFERDLPDFTGYSPDFNAAYKSNARQQLAEVSELVNPKQLMGELKVITTRIYANQGLLKTAIDKLDGYIKRTKNLSVAAADFGISAVRSKNNRGDIEGLSTAIKNLLTVVEINIDALTARGYTPAQHTALKQLQASFVADNTAQEMKMQQRSSKAVANNAVLDAFWDTLTDICAAGKIIYKEKAPHKVPEYTMTTIKKGLRNEGKKGSTTDVKKEG